MPVMRNPKQLFATQLVCLLAAVGSAQAQAPVKPFEPHVGQAGKDVVWVPTPQSLVEKMLDMAKVTPRDFLMDLGSGDGRTVITAARRGVRAIGVEYNPDMVVLSRDAATKAGVGDRATFVESDLFKMDLSKATVITMFLLPTINLQLRPTLLKLKPGTRIVSNSFDMGDWEPDETASVAPSECQNWCKALLWIVPARVQGAWKSTRGELQLTQTYQHLAGTLGAMPIKGRMIGDQLSFTAGNTEYVGRVNGTKITGKDWSAERVK